MCNNYGLNSWLFNTIGFPPFRSPEMDLEVDFTRFLGSGFNTLTTLGFLAPLLPFVRGITLKVWLPRVIGFSGCGSGGGGFLPSGSLIDFCSKVVANV